MINNNNNNNNINHTIMNNINLMIDKRMFMNVSRMHNIHNNNNNYYYHYYSYY